MRPLWHPLRGLIALHGLGGVGKTQIALEYAHRDEETYSAILWVDARDPTVLMTSGTRIVQQIVRHYFAGYPSNPESHLRIANELGIPGHRQLGQYPAEFDAGFRASVASHHTMAPKEGKCEMAPVNQQSRRPGYGENR